MYLILIRFPQLLFYKMKFTKRGEHDDGYNYNIKWKVAIWKVKLQKKIVLKHIHVKTTASYYK